MRNQLGLEILIGLPIAIVIVAGFVIGTVIVLVKRSRDSYDSVGYNMFAGMLALVAVMVSGFTAVLLYPYSSDYHVWRHHGGEVASVSARLLSDGSGGMNQRFVVHLVGDDGELSCDDTRCALVKPGDWLDLSCKRAWQYSGMDGYDCNYYRNTPATSGVSSAER